MYLMYCDQSGSEAELTSQHIVVAGISVFERQCFWLTHELDNIVARLIPENPSSVELNGYAMFSGRGIWRKFSKQIRLELIRECLLLLKHITPSSRIIISHVQKSQAGNELPSALAYEQLIHYFDHSLMHLHQAGNTQRGLIVCNQSASKLRLQELVNSYRTIGHRRGIVRNLAEVPLLLPSSASRILQLADLVAYSYYRSLQKHDHQMRLLIEDVVHFSYPIQLHQLAG